MRMPGDRLAGCLARVMLSQGPQRLLFQVSCPPMHPPPPHASLQRAYELTVLTAGTLPEVLSHT